MRSIQTITLIALIAVALSACGSGGSNVGSGLSASAEIDRDLKAFEAALDFTQYGSVTDGRQAVLELVYNEPSNPFWTLTLWLGVDRYNFKSWTKSINCTEAAIILKYTVKRSTDGTESGEMSKSFTMKRFDDRWRVNLSEFVNLE